MLQRGRKREGGHDGEVCPGVDRPLLSRDGKWDDGDDGTWGQSASSLPEPPAWPSPVFVFEGSLSSGRGEKRR